MDANTSYPARIFDGPRDITPPGWGRWPLSASGHPADTLDTELEPGGPAYRFIRDDARTDEAWVAYQLVGLAPR